MEVLAQDLSHDFAVTAVFLLFDIFQRRLQRMVSLLLNGEHSAAESMVHSILTALLSFFRRDDIPNHSVHGSDLNDIVRVDLNSPPWLGMKKQKTATSRLIRPASGSPLRPIAFLHMTVCGVNLLARQLQPSTLHQTMLPHVKIQVQVMHIVSACAARTGINAP